MGSLQSYILPHNVVPEQNNGNTLIQYPDFNDWAAAPLPHFGSLDDAVTDRDFKRLVQMELRLANRSEENGAWLKINKAIQIDFDLMSESIDEQVNLVFFVPGSCGGELAKLFTSVKLKPESTLRTQRIYSQDYDFFSLQPGESDVFNIDFVCFSPGIYQATATLSIESSEGLQDQKVSGFGKIICPKSYKLWIAGEDLAYPLYDKGVYFWDGDKYVEKP